jgi:hypothetical protein
MSWYGFDAEFPAIGVPFSAALPALTHFKQRNYLYPVIRLPLMPPDG